MAYRRTSLVEARRPGAADSEWTTISASATCAGPIGIDVPSKLTTPSSSPLWTTGAATSLRHRRGILEDVRNELTCWLAAARPMILTPISIS